MDKKYYHLKSEKTGITWIWYGGPGVYGYKGGSEVAFFVIGKSDGSKITKAYAAKQIQKVIKEGYENSYVTQFS